LDSHEFLKTLQEAVREYEFRYGKSLSEREEKPGFLNAHEILKRLGISKPTLYKYIKSGMPSQRVGGRRLFDWQEVSGWVKNHEPRI
jgi:excisionase family DNA binding protein